MSFLSIDLHSTSRSDRFSAASALLSIGYSRNGATVEDLERSDIALEELLDVLEQHGPLTGVRLDQFPDHFSLALHFDRTDQFPELPPGTVQLMDAGFDRWSLDYPIASISSRATQSTSHD